MIVIIDYGMGNVGSVLNMFRKIGADAMISSLPSDIERANQLVLPGVGAFDEGMRALEPFLPCLNKQVLKAKVPILGICLGLQLMTEQSEEGKLNGLGWIAARTVRFQFPTNLQNLKCPHMGWNSVKILKPVGLLSGIDEDNRFYFVHSYHLVCRQPQDVVGKTMYGYMFDSVIQKGHICGTQFHPEKSHRFGMQVLKNFARGAWC